MFPRKRNLKARTVHVLYVFLCASVCCGAKWIFEPMCWSYSWNTLKGRPLGAVWMSAMLLISECHWTQPPREQMMWKDDIQKPDFS